MKKIFTIRIALIASFLIGTAFGMENQFNESIFQPGFVQKYVTCNWFRTINSTVGKCFIIPSLDSKKIIISAPQNIMDTIQAYVRHDTLQLSCDTPNELTKNVQFFIGMNQMASITLQGSGRFKFDIDNMPAFIVFARDKVQATLVMKPGNMTSLCINGYENAVIKTRFYDVHDKKPCLIQRQTVKLNGCAQYNCYGIMTQLLMLTTTDHSKANLSAYSAYSHAHNCSEQVIQFFRPISADQSANLVWAHLTGCSYLGAFGQVGPVTVSTKDAAIFDDSRLICDENNKKVVKFMQ